MNRSVVILLTSLIVSGTAFAGNFNLDKDHVPGELIVKFKDGMKMTSAKQTLVAFGATKKTEFRSRGAMVIRFAKNLNGDDLLAVAKQLNARPDVEYVEANTILRVNARYPNDPSFSKQYGMNNIGGTSGTLDADIDAPEAWDITTGSKNVVVGIIDTGVDYTHPDIAPNYWSNPGETGLDANGLDKRTNGIDDDANGYIDDFRGWDFANNDNDPIDDHDHGTHCAGVIGARGNDGVGVTGVNWDVSMVGIKFLTGSGSGTLEDAVKAIEYGTTLGLTLTSNSWGGGGYSETMFAAIQAANEKNVLFIAAAGNDGRDNDSSPSYPASYLVENVISVAASDFNDTKASFSNWGKQSVHVAAPGVDIFSTTKSGRYVAMSGTSMATPHVAGLAALIKAAYPSILGRDIKNRIFNSVDRIAGWETLTASGGRVNALSALEVDTIPPSVVSGLTVSTAGTRSVTLSWAASGDDGHNGQASSYQLRTSSTPIVSQADWDRATVVSAVIKVSGESLEATIEFESFNQKGYVAVLAVDNVGNRSEISPSIAYETRAVRKIYEKSAVNMDGLTAEVPWAIETLADGTTVFSDSPGGNYAEKANVSLATDALSIETSDLTLAVDLQYDLEKGYDFLRVEVSTDSGVTWAEAGKFTGSSNERFVKGVFSLGSFVGSASAIRVRFRLQSDGSVSKNGVGIRSLDIFGPM